jgi:hypothetical protein
VNQRKQDAWNEAKRRCRLSDEEIRMAKELGMQPKSLMKNIPSPSQRWKAPVNEWVRSVYEEKIGARKPAVPAPDTRLLRPQVIEFRDPENPWPDNPVIPDLVVDHDFEEASEDVFEYRSEPPSEADIEEEHILMLRRQRLFRWAAQSVAIALSQLPEVRKVAVFGAVAQPLRMEVPRFREFRRSRIEVPHECGDLDLAAWTSDQSRLKEMKRALNRGLSYVQDTPYGGVAHHQVDIHVFSAADLDYKGRLCIFGECPKPGKRECFVPHCGEQPFLQQFERYRFNPAQFESEPKTVLFDRESGFLVRPPRIEVQPTRFVNHPKEGDREG